MLYQHAIRKSCIQSLYFERLQSNAIFSCLCKSFKFKQSNAKSCNIAKYRRQLLTAAVTAIPKSIKLAITNIVGMFAKNKNKKFALLPNELYILTVLTAAIR